MKFKLCLVEYLIGIMWDRNWRIYVIYNFEVRNKKCSVIYYGFSDHKDVPDTCIPGRKRSRTADEENMLSPSKFVDKVRLCQFGSWIWLWQFIFIALGILHSSSLSTLLTDKFINQFSKQSSNIFTVHIHFNFNFNRFWSRCFLLFFLLIQRLFF